MTSTLRCGVLGRFWSYRTGAMQDPEYELPRNPILGRWVNKGKRKGRRFSPRAGEYAPLLPSATVIMRPLSVYENVRHHCAATVKFSYEMLPAQPVPTLLEIVDLLDKLGFYACYSADETYHKDMWQIFAVAATRTNNVRLSPDVTHVIIKDTTVNAQQVATLD